MFKFTLKVILFLSPIALYYAFPIAVLFFSKEYYPAYEVVAIQNTHKETLFGNVYNTGSLIPYKTILLDTNNPQIFALGTSRVLQLRKEFFTPQTQFLNAGLGVPWSLNDIEYILQSASSSQNSSTKRVLILDLDRELFTLDSEQADQTTENYISIFGFHFYAPFNVARGMYLDYFIRHKYSFIKLVSNEANTDKLGMQAIANGNGFRSDGSYRYNKESQDPNLVATNEAEIKVVAQNILRDTPASLPSTDEPNIAANLIILKQILETAKSKNITVVGYIPPYPVEINQATFASTSAYKTRETDLTNQISADFKQDGFAFYDMSDIAQYGGTDAEFSDTVHGTDLLYAKMSLYLANHDPVLKNYFDKTALQNMIASTTGNFLQF